MPPARLEYTYSAAEIESIERERKTLCDLYHHDLNVKGSIESLDDGGSFDAAWIALHSAYPFLEIFDGGFASIFLRHISLKALSRLPSTRRKITARIWAM